MTLYKQELNKVTISNHQHEVVYTSSSMDMELGAMLNIAMSKASGMFKKTKQYFVVDGFVNGLRVAYHRIDSDHQQQ